MSFLQDIGWYGLNKLEVWELNEAGQLLSRMRVRKANNQLLIEDYDAEPDFPTQVSPHLPIILALRLDNIIKSQMSLDESDVVSKLLGVSIEDVSDFVWQVNPIDEQSQWACLVRRQSLEMLWQRLAPFARQILYLNLSDLSQQILLDSPAENDKEAELRVLKDELEVSEEALYPYSVAMQYFCFKGRDLHGLEWDLGLADQFSQTSKWLKTLSLLSGVCLAIQLLFLFGQTQLSDRLDERQFLIQQQQPKLAEIDSLQQQIADYEQYLDQSQTNEFKSRVSFYLDRSAQFAPDNLHFDKWIYSPNPAQCKKLGLSKDLAPLILIKGTASNASSISEFAQKLQQQITQHKVELLQSHYNIQQQLYQFSLLLL